MSFIYCVFTLESRSKPYDRSRGDEKNEQFTEGNCKVSSNERHIFIVFLHHTDVPFSP